MVGSEELVKRDVIVKMKKSDLTQDKMENIWIQLKIVTPVRTRTKNPSISKT